MRRWHHKVRRIWRTGGAAPPVISGDNRRGSGGAPPDNLNFARDAVGRFLPGASGNPEAQFQPGRSGNPAGRPPGSLRAGARAAAALLDEHAEFIAGQAIELVRARDPVSVRHCLKLILGVRRGQPVELAMPAVAAPADLTAAVAAVTGALAEGRITPDEARACAQMLDGLPRILAAVPPPPNSSDDPRRTLARKLARLASSVEEETLRQAAVLASIPSAGPPEPTRREAVEPTTPIAAEQIMGGQPGKPSPPGNPPVRPDPEQPAPVEEPPLPIQPPPVEPPPAPMQVHAALEPAGAAGIADPPWR